MWEVEDLRRRVGLGADDDSDDATLLEIEAAAVAHFQRETNRYFGPVTTLVDAFSPGGALPRLRLSAPVTSITKIEVRGLSWSAWTEPWAAGAYEFSGDLLELVDGSVFPRGRQNVRVTFQGGYAAGQEPPDVREAVVTIVNKSWRSRVTALEGEDSLAANAGVTVALAVPKVARDIIDTWRRRPGT